jgi:Rod binding domain-containing protein
MDVLAPLHGQALTPDQNLATTATATRNGDLKNIEKVATGLESMFFSLLCKEMRETLEPGTLFGGDQGDVFGGMFDQFLGEHLAQGGSLGIAAMVRKQLTAQYTHEQHPGKLAPAAGRTAGKPLS